LVDEEEVILKLLMFGFTKYEAKVYYALLKHGSLTSTELLKIARIPQARLYDVIERLVSKGLVKVSRSRPAKYSIINPELALKSYIEQEMVAKAKIAEDIVRSVERSGEVVEDSYIWTVSGVHSITVVIRDLVESAEDELLIATYTHLMEKMMKSLEGVKDKEISTCVILYDKDGKIAENLAFFDEVRFKPTLGPTIILKDLLKGLLIPRSYRQRPVAYIIEDLEILSPIINYFFYLKETSSPIIYRLGEDVRRRRFRSLIRAIEMIQRMQENGIEVGVEIEGRWRTSGEPGKIVGKPINAIRDKYREITSLIVEQNGSRILVGGRGATYEDFEALRITVYPLNPTADQPG